MRRREPCIRKKRGEPLEDHQLPTRVDELLIHDVTMHAWPFEQCGVRADHAQLHHNVLQAHVVNIDVGLFHCFPAGRDAEQR